MTGYRGSLASALGFPGWLLAHYTIIIGQVNSQLEKFFSFLHKRKLLQDKELQGGTIHAWGDRLA